MILGFCNRGFLTVEGLDVGDQWVVCTSRNPKLQALVFSSAWVQK